MCRKLRIWSHLLTKSLMENFIFCAVIPSVVGSLGAISKQFGKRLKETGITAEIGQVQKTVLLETARILRKVLEI